MITASISAVSVNAVVLDKSFDQSNSYLHSIQTYSYDSLTNATSATNMTICRKDNYTAILSYAEIRNALGSIYSNKTDFRPEADNGSFLRVTAQKNIYTMRVFMLVTGHMFKMKMEIIRARLT